MRLYYTKSKENAKSIEQTLKKGYKTKIKHFDVVSKFQDTARKNPQRKRTIHIFV